LPARTVYQLILTRIVAQTTERRLTSQTAK
jgi:hypothetical protein